MTFVRKGWLCMTDQKQSGWYYLIDGIRGLALLNMLFFHFFYDVYMIFGQDPDWYSQTWVHIWQQYICISFLFISGISWHFSHNNLKRGIRLNLYGLAITAVTLLFLPSQTVWFGILNCIGCATLLLLPLKRFLTGKNAAAGLVLSLLLFLLTWHLTDGYVGIAGIRLRLPDWLYAFRPMTILGFPYPGFCSSDYFPILPWFFLFLAGYWFWELISQDQTALSVFHKRIPVLSRLGKQTVWIYLLHQPLLYGAAYLLTEVAEISFA